MPVNRIVASSVPANDDMRQSFVSPVNGNIICKNNFSNFSNFLHIFDIIGNKGNKCVKVDENEIINGHLDNHENSVKESLFINEIKDANLNYMHLDLNEGANITSSEENRVVYNENIENNNEKCINIYKVDATGNDINKEYYYGYI